MNLNDEKDDDILNDAKNLFIDDKEIEGNNEFYDENKNSIYIEPEPEHETSPIRHSKLEINLLKAPLDNNREKKSEKTPSPIFEDIIPETIITKPPTEPAKAEEVYDKIKNKKDRSDKCKSNSECDSNSFCIVKTGKCTTKLRLNQSDCSSSDQCLDPTAICYSKTCMLSCKIGDDSACKAEGQGCVKVKDFKVFQGIQGKFDGVCDKLKNIKPPPPPTIKKSNPNVTKMAISNLSVAIISGSTVILLTLLIICFIYLRGYFKRRHHNTSPDMFLFNKLQRNASQTMAAAQKSNSLERLNMSMRLSNVGGARFTRWAALTNENTS